jgi:hypothetical protein
MDDLPSSVNHLQIDFNQQSPFPPSKHLAHHTTGKLLETSPYQPGALDYSWEHPPNNKVIFGREFYMLR